jgi:hypothetical protein
MAKKKRKSKGKEKNVGEGMSGMKYSKGGTRGGKIR